MTRNHLGLWPAAFSAAFVAGCTDKAGTSRDSGPGHHDGDGGSTASDGASSDGAARDGGSAGGGTADGGTAGCHVEFSVVQVDTGHR